LCLAAAAQDGAGQGAHPSAPAPPKWNDILEQPPAWYAGAEAVRVADNVLAYQRETGGWHKNTDMGAALSEAQMAEIAKEKSKNDSTIDNGATFTQLNYLARVYTAAKHERHREAFLKGVDYLLKAQYENGGWPQFYPDLSGYRKHITYNDGAMIGVMRLLRDIAAKKSDFAFVDEERRARAARAVEKGVEVILKTQVVVGGRRTVWGAQHDSVTLAPAAARVFEPVSLSAGESVALVRFLMGLKNPPARVVEAVESAVAWYEKAKLGGVRWVERRDASKPGGFDRAAVKDPNAPPLWARFYEIETTRPIFVGRDGVIKYDVSEIDEERRNGYQWYVSTPARLLNEEYPAWRKKLERR
jgi:PelA/Pel-15E family pectate lyase